MIYKKVSLVKVSFSGKVVDPGGKNQQNKTKSYHAFGFMHYEFGKSIYF